MVSLSVITTFQYCIPTNCTQKVTLFDLKSATRYSASFFLPVILEIFVALIHEFGHQRITLGPHLENKSNLALDFSLTAIPV